VVRWLLRSMGFVLPWIELPPGAVIVAPNHQSLLDGPLVSCLTDRVLLFAVDPAWCCRQPWRFGLLLLKWLGFGATVPLDAGKPFAWRRLASALRAGQAVCLFPEGAIAPEGAPLPIQPGVAKLARLTSAQVVPVRIEGTRDLFARRRGRNRRPSASIAALAPVGACEPQLERLLAEALQPCAARDRIALAAEPSRPH
jgi:1-acyl-sn-glycerol-3-phosphate acyltransferase